MKGKDGKVYTAKRLGATTEEIHNLRKDYEMGVRLRGTEGIARVVDWKDGLILEPLEPLKPGKLPFPEFLRMAVQISGVVARLHDQGIIHNGINPRFVTPIAPGISL